MKKLLLLTVVLFAASATSFGAGYSVGDVVSDFRLLNVDGNYVSLSDYSDAKGFVVVFTCNHCPVAVQYEDRIIDLDKKYSPLGYPVIAINPNDPAAEPRDSYELMKVRAQEKGFTFPYLFDNGQKVFPVFGATRTPHVFLLNKEDGQNVVAYIGAIDDNSRDANSVQETYLANAIDALLNGQTPSPDYTVAVGCSIKSVN